MFPDQHGDTCSPRSYQKITRRLTFSFLLLFVFLLHLLLSSVPMLHSFCNIHIFICIFAACTGLPLPLLWCNTTGLPFEWTHTHAHAPRVPAGLSPRSNGETLPCVSASLSLRINSSAVFIIITHINIDAQWLCRSKLDPFFSIHTHLYTFASKNFDLTSYCLRQHYFFMKEK